MKTLLLFLLLIIVASCTPSYHQQVKNRQKAFRKGNYIKPKYVDNLKSQTTGLSFPITNP